ncbi:hypothetical protein OIU85_002965 [Salix viminalis]|uniref:RING-type E3 ubiquitin transferase n=1 Tax=Salix viminalis TaxID=40686 RepID=A0A6N2LFH4_SALVM|nr:hypothetical protein OIU85_002965 [Salix viminalis]
MTTRLSLILSDQAEAFLQVFYRVEYLQHTLSSYSYLEPNDKISAIAKAHIFSTKLNPFVLRDPSMEAWCQRRFLSGDATDRIKQAMQTSVLYRPHRFLLGMDSGMAPDSHGSRNSSDYILDSDESFESNMVIVLVGLICAFVCALGINSIARCAIRYGYRIGFETPHQAASRLAAATSTGLKKSALGQIPVVSYESGLNNQVTGCTICLGEFSDGEKVRVLPKCSHGFHVQCIDKWLSLHSSCPLCRQTISLDRSANNGDVDVPNVRIPMPDRRIA